MRKADRVLAVGVGIALFAVASVWTVDRYGGASYWPSLVAQFAATLVAVVLALEFESRRENRALKLVEEQRDATRTTEARKRLLAVRLELEKNQTSIGEIVEGVLPTAGTWRILHPQLLDGAWSASGQRLGDLLADYELVSDLSVFYGRVEELRWRVRYRTQSRDPSLDEMTLDGTATVFSPNVGSLHEGLFANVTLTPDEKGRVAGTLTLSIPFTPSPGPCTCGPRRVDYLDLTLTNLTSGRVYRLDPVTRIFP